MPRRNKYEMAYARIEKLLQHSLVDLEPGDTLRLHSGEAIMDLVVEVLPNCHEDGATILSMVHYFEQNGELCRDPEMVIRLFNPGTVETPGAMVPYTDPKHGRAEALTFQQDLPPIYSVVYPEPGKFSPRLHKDLNNFLADWLRNLKEQGHQPVGSIQRDP